jgi:hypothetical protein
MTSAIEKTVRIVRIWGGSHDRLRSVDAYKTSRLVLPQPGIQPAMSE